MGVGKSVAQLKQRGQAAQGMKPGAFPTLILSYTVCTSGILDMTADLASARVLSAVTGSRGFLKSVAKILLTMPTKGKNSRRSVI